MNSFRKAVLSGQGLSRDPLLREKHGRGLDGDDLSAVEVPRSEGRLHDHRDDDRHRLNGEGAKARFDGEEYPADLINLSGGGAMIRTDCRPRLWDRLDLVLGDGQAIQCAVRWLRDDRVGLEFAHETTIECDVETRDSLLLDTIRRSFPGANIITQHEPVHTGSSAESIDAEDDSVINSRRGERRHPLVWLGKVFYNHECEKVRLRNISEHGALIEAPISYPVGAEVYLDLDEGGQHFATVSWNCSDKAGLAFKVPFDLKLLGKSKPTVAPSLMTRPGPGSVYADQDNPWAEGWNRQSLDELRTDLEGYLKR
ncbi:PilZ domain-containing protein [Sphingomonas xanthus]|nr:PilZ domain-containing protein [Sphingomonas xanthus]